jgi:probable HAF family extracellular repeat protein
MWSQLLIEIIVLTQFISPSEPRSHAFLYDPSLGMQDIGRSNLVSYALDINNNAQVVGVEIDDAGKMHAFIHDGTNSLRWLENLISPNTGWTQLSEAGSINNLGQIVGIGLYNGESHAFLLTPIPEPSTFILLLAAVYLLKSTDRSRTRSRQ